MLRGERDISVGMTETSRGSISFISIFLTFFSLLAPLAVSPSQPINIPSYGLFVTTKG